MNDIFISYSRADKDKAKILARLLKKQGWSVWWDVDISIGKQFDLTIKEQLDNAKCVVVLWSKASVSSEWVKDEASEAVKRGVLIPLLIEDVEIPFGFGFRRIQTANLVDWLGDHNHPEISAVLRSISLLLDRPRKAADINLQGVTQEKGNAVTTDPSQNLLSLSPTDRQATTSDPEENTSIQSDIPNDSTKLSLKTRLVLGRLANYLSQTRVRVGITLFVILIAGVIVLYRVIFHPITPETKTGKPDPIVEIQQTDSIAIIPFEIKGVDEDTKSLLNGILRGVTERLKQITTLKVRSWEFAGVLKDRKLEDQDIGRQLEAKYILSGKINKRGNKLTLLISLTNVKDGDVLLAPGELKHPISEVSLFEPEIVGKILEALGINPNEEERKRLAKHNPKNSAAYPFYLRGIESSNLGTEKDFREAIDFFNQALQIDPDYALPYVGMAEAYFIVSTANFSPKTIGPKALEAATTAVKYGDELAEAHAALGWVKFLYEQDYNSAEDEFNKAIQINPNCAPAYSHYSVLLSIKAEPDAIKYIATALSIDSKSLDINLMYGQLNYFKGILDEAEKIFKHAEDLYPKVWLPYWYRSLALESAGEFDEATRDLEEARKLDPPDETGWIRAEQARIFALRGDKGSAKKLSKELEDEKRNHFISPYLIATIYTALDDIPQALNWLEKAVAEGDEWALALKVDPKIEILRRAPRDPRFDACLKKFKLSD
jgi:tetratricopeptide (TPR) repeat protein